MNDPFVNEIRQFRHEHAHQFHNELASICDDLRTVQATCGQKVVTFPPKRVSTQTRVRKSAETGEQVAA